MLLWGSWQELGPHSFCGGKSKGLWFIKEPVKSVCFEVCSHGGKELQWFFFFFFFFKRLENTSQGEILASSCLFWQSKDWSVFMVCTYLKGSFMKITTMCSPTLLCKNTNWMGLNFNQSGSNQRHTRKLSGGGKSGQRFTSGGLSGGWIWTSLAGHTLPAGMSQPSCPQQLVSNCLVSRTLYVLKIYWGPPENFCLHVLWLLTFIILEINTREFKKY